MQHKNKNNGIMKVRMYVRTYNEFNIIAHRIDIKIDGQRQRFFFIFIQIGSLSEFVIFMEIKNVENIIKKKFKIRGNFKVKSTKQTEQNKMINTKN